MAEPMQLDTIESQVKTSRVAAHSHIQGVFLFVFVLFLRCESWDYECL